MMSLPNVKVNVERRANIDAIEDRFRQRSEGNVIEHEELEQLTGLTRRDSKYQSMVSAARHKFQEETGIKLQSVRCVGYKFPTGDEQVDAGTKKLRMHVRGVGRAARDVGDVRDDRLPDANQRAKRDHVVGCMNYLAQVMRTQHRALVAQVGTPEVKPQIALAT